jgi:hypothetical protein
VGFTSTILEQILNLSLAIRVIGLSEERRKKAGRRERAEWHTKES